MRRLCFLLVLLSGAPALATTILRLTRAELAARSDVIVRAQVGAQEIVRSPRSGRILTRSVLRISEAYKGSRGGEIVLEQMGGTLDGMTLFVPGDARLERGEEAVFFLRCDGGPLCHLSGLALGKYTVRTDALGRRIAARDAVGLKGPDGRPIDAEALPLEQLARELRERPQ
jgi:hypothetical protein